VQLDAILHLAAGAIPGFAVTGHTRRGSASGKARNS